MKTLLLMLMVGVTPLACAAQQQDNKQAKPVKVETIHERTGGYHYHTHTVVPERHTVTRWHYHVGQKSPQAAGSQPPSGPDKPASPSTSTENNKEGARK